MQLSQVAGHNATLRLGECSQAPGAGSECSSGALASSLGGPTAPKLRHVDANANNPLSPAAFPSVLLGAPPPLRLAGLPVPFGSPSAIGSASPVSGTELSPPTPGAASDLSSAAAVAAAAFTFPPRLPVVGGLGSGVGIGMPNVAYTWQQLLQMPQPSAHPPALTNPFSATELKSTSRSN